RERAGNRRSDLHRHADRLPARGGDEPARGATCVQPDEQSTRRVVAVPARRVRSARIGRPEATRGGAHRAAPRRGERGALSILAVARRAAHHPLRRQRVRLVQDLRREPRAGDIRPTIGEPCRRRRPLRRLAEERMVVAMTSMTVMTVMIVIASTYLLLLL